jgi:hypothetical protein
MNRRYVACGIIALVMFVIAGCSRSLCENDEVRTSASPDGTLSAVVFRRSCGATTGFSTHVSVIQRQASLPDDPGNALTVGGEQPVQVIWQDPAHLLISGFKEPVFKRMAKVGAIQIAFR